LANSVEAVNAKAAHSQGMAWQTTCYGFSVVELKFLKRLVKLYAETAVKSLVKKLKITSSPFELKLGCEKGFVQLVNCSRR
jgi:hypothetical protein